MTCRHVRQLHDAYVDGELSPSLMAEMHAHLLQCPECQRQVELTRACGTIIAGDGAEAGLDAKFADRIVAALPQTVFSKQPGSASSRPRRLSWRRLAISAALPAAAAVLFLGVVVWPTAEPEAGPRLVLGESVSSGVEEIVQPTWSVVSDTRQAAADLNRILEISVGEATQDVEKGLQKLKETEMSAWEELIFGPFTGLLDAIDPQTGEDGQEETVRF